MIVELLIERRAGVRVGMKEIQSCEAIVWMWSKLSISGNGSVLWRIARNTEDSL